jgi:hypothetical protein
MIEDDVKLYDFKHHSNVSNGTAIWHYLREQCDYTSTDLVELSGCGYGSVTNFLMRKKNPHLSQPERPKFLQRILQQGIEGEVDAFEEFVRVYDGLVITEPYFVTYTLGLGSKGTFRLGSSFDGFIRNTIGEVVCPIEVKTITTSPINVSKWDGSVHIVMKRKWIFQCFLETHALGQYVCVLILWDRTKREMIPFLLDFSDFPNTDFWASMATRMGYGKEKYRLIEGNMQANIPETFGAINMKSRVFQSMSIYVGITRLPAVQSETTRLICEQFKIGEWVYSPIRDICHCMNKTVTYSFTNK